MPLQYVIGIDIGTGSTKAVAVNSSGHVLATAQEYYPELPTKVPFSEQDPDAIWQAVVRVINNIPMQLKEQPDCICFSSCMHSLLVLDEKHQPISNLITWADGRSAAEAEALRNSANAEHLYTITGTPIHSMSPLCKIIWLHKNAKQVFLAAAKFISIKEYIWFRLFNKFQVDYSIASATGLFDNTSFTWSKEALTLAGISTAQLSELVPTSFIASSLSQLSAEILQLPLQTKFCIGASDGCLANVGSNALRKGVAAVTIGTSAAVRIAHHRPMAHFASMLFSYVLDEHTFICGAPVSNGGNVVQWLQQNFMGDEAQDYDSIFQKIESIPPGCDRLICLPYFYGERGPVWDEKASGSFLGIRSHHTQAHFLRAAVEGVCYALKWILEIIEEQSGPVKSLQVSGGFVRSIAWLQMLADVTGKPLCLVQTEDASATGAAYWALKATGLITDIEAIHRTNEKIVEPDVSKQLVYHRHYQIYKPLYSLLKNTMHQLYHLNP